MSRPLRMTEAASEVGLSYERFRKVWREMVELQAFPAPFHGRCWDREAVTAWKAQRSAQRVVTEIRAAPEPQGRQLNTRAARDRAALQQLRAG